MWKAVAQSSTSNIWPLCLAKVWWWMFTSWFRLANYWPENSCLDWGWKQLMLSTIWYLFFLLGGCPTIQWQISSSQMASYAAQLYFKDWFVNFFIGRWTNGCHPDHWFFCNTVIALNSPYIADASHQILGVVSPLQMIVSALHAMIHDAITIQELCIYLHTGL